MTHNAKVVLGGVFFLLVISGLIRIFDFTLDQRLIGYDAFELKLSHAVGWGMLISGLMGVVGIFCLSGGREAAPSQSRRLKSGEVSMVKSKRSQRDGVSIRLGASPTQDVDRNFGM